MSGEAQARLHDLAGQRAADDGLDVTRNLDQRR
jgi:hypothetical protein